MRILSNTVVISLFRKPIQASNQDNEFILSPDILLALGPPGGEGVEPNPLTSTTSQMAAENHANRLKLIKELAPRVREQRLQHHGVELLWVKTKDLLETSDVEQRNNMLLFYECMVRGQVGYLLIECKA